MTLQQFKMVDTILISYRNRVSESEALKFDQRSFGSLCGSKMIDFEFNGNGMGHFFVTAETKALYRAKKEWEGFRINNNGMFSVKVRIPKHKKVMAINFSRRRRQAAFAA